jgi:hypothetical protein
MYDQGYQPAAIAKQLGQTIRAQLTDGQLELERQQALGLLGQLIGVPASHEPASLLEIVLLANLRTSSNGTVHESPPVKKPAQKPVATEKPKQTAAPKKPEAVSAKTQLPIDENLWPQVLAALKQKHNTLYGVARMAQPKLEDGKLELAFGFAFHQKRLKEPANQQLITGIIKDLTGQAVAIEYVVDEAAPATESSAPEDASGLSAISNIFGGGELLES